MSMTEAEFAWHFVKDFEDEFVEPVTDAPNYPALHGRARIAIDRIETLQGGVTPATESTFAELEALKRCHELLADAVLDWVIETESPDGEDGT